jgi:hypothetical protein
LVFDDEIVSGWTVDDANLNTRCPHCQNKFNASLKVSIREREGEVCGTSWYMPLIIDVKSGGEEKEISKPEENDLHEV